MPGLRQLSELGRCLARRAWLLAAFVALALPRLASGYGDQAAIDIEHFHPAAGETRLLTLDLARVRGHLNWTPQGTVHYSDRPLVLLCHGNCPPQRYVSWVAHRVTLDLSLALSIAERLQLALSLPVALYQYSAAEIVPGTSGGSSSGGLFAPVPAVAGLQNVRLHAKVSFLPKHWAAGLGLATSLALPSGDGNSFLGTRLPDLTTRLLGDVVVGRFALAGAFGARFAETVDVLSLHDGIALIYGLGAQIRLIGDKRGEKPLYVLAELYGRADTRFAPTRDYPLEYLIGVKAEPGPWSMTGGFGSTILPGVGTPNVRCFVGVAYHGRRAEP